MKLSTFTILCAIAGSTSAFTPQVSKRSCTSLSSTAVATAPSSRFERLKKNYKGVKPDLDDSTLDFGYDDFAAAVAETNYSFNRNEVVKGVAVEYDGGGCIVDIGAKANAFLPSAEAALITNNAPIEELVQLDTELEFQIISEEDENGQLLVSIRRIQYQEAWKSVAALQDTDTVFEAEVVAVNRGGAICLVHGLRAFLPGSHLVGMIPTEDMIGTKLSLKFLEVNPENNKLVVSNRRAVVEKQMSDLSRGDLVDGVVKALKPYGAFIEVGGNGGMSGLLHISQISYDRINKLDDVLQVDMPIKCMIIDHDKANGRIALSTKTIEPQPGDMLKDAAAVFEKAEETARIYHERMEEERKQRESTARDIVLGLGDSLDDLGMIDDGEDGEATAAPAGEVKDPLEDVSDNLDSLLS